MGVFLQGCRTGLLFFDELGSQPVNLGYLPSIPPHQHQYLGRGNPRPPSTTSRSQYSDSACFEVAFRGSGLDLWGGGQCPGWESGDLGSGAGCSFNRVA